MTIVRSPFDLALRFNSNSVRAEGKNKSLRIIEAIELNKIGAGAGKTRIFKAVAGDFKVKASPTQLFLDTSPVIPNVELVNVHPLITLVFKRDVNKSSRGSSSWKDKSLLTKLTKVDFKPGYSVSGKGLQNTIHQDTFSTKNSTFNKNEQEANCLKGAIMRTQPAQREFLSNLFLVGKKDEGYCPVINLKMLNQFIPFLHFKVEGL